MNLNKVTREGGWSLFLDRDGVINRLVEKGYVLNPDDLEVIEGVPDALAILGHIFRHIIIVTNQQCISKGLISMDEMEGIHNYMRSLIDPENRIISSILVSPHSVDDNNEFRKPGIGMALKAVELYPDIDLTKSIMIGDMASDMKFGRKAGMLNVLITGNPAIDRSLYDFTFRSLFDFALHIKRIKEELND